MDFFTPNKTIELFNNIVNGTLVVFVIAICASQMSHYAEIKNPKDNRWTALVFGIAFLIIILSTVVFIKASDINDRENLRIIIFSFILFSGTITFCLYLYGLRLSYESTFESAQQRGKALSHETIGLDQTEDGILL